MTPEQEHKLFTTLGCIRKGVDDNTKAIEKQNGTVAALAKRVTGHDVFIGRVGLGISLVAFFITVGVNGIIAWFRFLK